MKLNLSFSGGVETLFGNVRELDIDLPDKVGDGSPTIRHLLPWIKSNLLKDRPELFLQGDSIRPGILVLINDADWELEGELDYSLQEKDSIVFISTLHGG